MVSTAYADEKINLFPRLHFSTPYYILIEDKIYQPHSGRKSKSMRTYDITLTISPDLVVWPDDLPVELYKTAAIADGNDANVSRIHMGVHTGTHVDAPYHFLG